MHPCPHQRFEVLPIPDRTAMISIVSYSNMLVMLVMLVILSLTTYSWLEDLKVGTGWLKLSWKGRDKLKLGQEHKHTHMYGGPAANLHKRMASLAGSNTKRDHINVIRAIFNG